MRELIMLMALPTVQTLIALGGAAAIVLTAIVAYALLRGWNTAKWVRSQMRGEVHEVVATDDFHVVITKIIEKDRESDHFRKAVQTASADRCKQDVSECVSRHNESSEAHGSYRRMADAFVRSHIAQELTAHNESAVAHHAALARYPDRDEMQGAIARVELLIATNQSILLEKLGSISTQLTDMKERH